MEKALRRNHRAIRDSGGFEYLARARHRSRQIDQGSAHVRLRAKHFGEQHPRAAADIDNCADASPFGRLEQNIRIARAVAWPHQQVEACGDFRVGFQIGPIVASKLLVIGRFPGTDRGQERAPGIRHPAAESFEIESGAPGIADQAAREIVQGEVAGTRLLKQSFRNKMPQNALQRFRIGSSNAREIFYFRMSRLDVIGKPQRRDDVHAPRRAQIGEFPEFQETAYLPSLLSYGAPVPVEPRNSFCPFGSVMSRPFMRSDPSLDW